MMMMIIIIIIIIISNNTIITIIITITCVRRQVYNCVRLQRGEEGQDLSENSLN